MSPRTTLLRAAALSGLALAATGLPCLTTAAQATPASHLLISEVYGGGGNTSAIYTNDFVELFNPTGSAISTSGLSLQYRAKATTSASGSVYDLPTTGSVPAGGYYLVQLAAGTTVTNKPLPVTPDASTTSINMSGTDGQVYLVNGTTGIAAQTDSAAPWTFDPSVIDFVGYGAAAVYEGTGAAPAPSNGTAITRDSANDDTDSNAADFTTTSNPSIQDSSSSGSGTTSPVTVAALPDVVETEGTAIAPITASASGGTKPYSWSASGLPSGVSIDSGSGVISGTPTSTGDDKVTVTATDSSNPAMTGTTTFYMEVPLDQSIAQIQGTDTSTSPDVGDEVRTTGVVTAVYATGGFNGFYLQTGGSGGSEADDATPGASDGVFVYGATAAGQVSTGESISVTGEVAEYQGETQIEYPTVTALGTALAPVTPDTIPWSDLSTDAEKQAHEGELMAPQGDFTVTDDYNTNFYGEIELAAGDSTLQQPTNAGAPGSTAAENAAAYNDAHAVTLDDGSSTTFSPTGSSKNQPLPWLTTTTPVSIGSQVSFHQPVILDYRNSLWDFQPTQPVVGDGSAVATFSDMRTQNAAPGAVGGNARLATFNMENFFPTTADQFVADNSGATCSYYDDRAGNQITANTCTFANGDPGPRGAATEDSFQRQLAKEVTSINGLGASIVSLEEVENGAKFTADIPTLPAGVSDRDYALQVLVDALNQADGAGTWTYVPSPDASQLPPIGEQDVIRTGFIYKSSIVTPVGASHVLADDSGPGQPFSVAREPLAQGFKAVGAPDSDDFLVVANHLKSKGTDASGLFNDCANGGDTENSDPAYDQGAFNCTRVHEVTDMWAWAQTQAQALNTDRIFLVGDFNAYDHEDPIQYLLGQGLTDVGATDDPAHSSYSYDGLEGSLDHVFATSSAFAMVTGASIWQINAQESVAFAYSRYNYSGTTPNLFDGSTPWATSDHDPEVVGLSLPQPGADATVTSSPVTVAYGSPVTASVTVSGDSGTPTGTVAIANGSQKLGTVTVSKKGTATFKAAKMTLPVGTHTLSLTYSGDSTYRPATGSVNVTVVKADVQLTGSVSGTVQVGQTSQMQVTASATGVTPTGRVEVVANGEYLTATLSQGTATFTLPAFDSAGDQQVTLVYAGDSKVKAKATNVDVEVSP